MKLTETQRDFLTKTLGVKPSGKGLFQRRSAEEKKDDAATAAFDDYLRREKKVLESVRELENVPGTQKLVSDFEKELETIQQHVKVAKRENADAVFKKAYKDLDSVKTRAEAEAATHAKNLEYYTELDAARHLIQDLKNHPQHAHANHEIAAAEADLITAERRATAGKFKEARVAVEAAKQKCAEGKQTADEYALYEGELAAVQLLVDGLKSHAQKLHIHGEIAAAVAGLVKAKSLAKAGKLTQARAAVAAARKKCEDAKKSADDYAQYAIKRAAAAVLIHSLRGINDDTDTYLDGLDAKVTEADTEAGPAKRDFVKATALVEAVTTELTGVFKSAYVDEVKPKIQALKDKASAFVAKDLKDIDALQAVVETSIGKSAWRKVILTGAQVSELLGTATKLADRRKAYDDQRALTRKAIDSLKAKPSLLGQIAAMDKLVEQADGLADRAVMRMEDGVAQLKELEARCAELLKVAADADAYKTERKAADEKMAALAKHSAVANLGEVLPAIQVQLDQAAKLAGDINAIGSQDWKAARAIITRVMADLDAAAKLAEKAKDLQDTASGAGDAAAVKKAVAKLRTQAEVITKAEHADLAKTELDKVKSCLDEAESQANGGHPDKAAAPLKNAADLLAIVQAVQLQQTRFVELRTGLENRQKALLKSPVAPAIKAKTDAIATALAQADAQGKSRSWPEATAAIDAAEQAASEAEETARLREEYSDRAKDLTETLRKIDKKGGLTKKERKDIQDDLKSAASQADAFRFDQAKGSLDSAEARLEALTLNKLAKQTPPNAAVLANSAKIMAKGGARVLDALVKQLPNDVPFLVIADLAKVRFGIELKSDAGSATRSAKKIWEMLAKVPEDVVGNPSLKEVRREEPGKNGGYYQSDGDLVVMNGRPGKDFQEFGPNIKDELPDDVEPDCKPVNNGKVDYFDFATLHEVGHSVDDSTQFMASKEGKEPFGGWISYGGAVEPIAAAVAEWAGYNGSPEQKKYVLDLILGNEPEPPVTTPDKQPDWDEALKKVMKWHTLATNEHIWWQQANSKEITIKGVVYQEAYKRTWVSYLAKARSQGITGYQFRAPGEWFAELYASYRIGKLKKTHPARKWLSSLAI